MNAAPCKRRKKFVRGPFSQRLLCRFLFATFVDFGRCRLPADIFQALFRLVASFLATKASLRPYSVLWKPLLSYSHVQARSYCHPTYCRPPGPPLADRPSPARRRRPRPLRHRGVRRARERIRALQHDREAHLEPPETKSFSLDVGRRAAARRAAATRTTRTRSAPPRMTVRRPRRVEEPRSAASPSPRRARRSTRSTTRSARSSAPTAARVS